MSCTGRSCPLFNGSSQPASRVGLLYGETDHTVPYSPLHSKYCIIDEATVIEGSFNWYNTSVFSHDITVVATNRDMAQAYLHEFYQMQRLFRVYS